MLSAQFCRGFVARGRSFRRLTLQGPEEVDVHHDIFWPQLNTTGSFCSLGGPRVVLQTRGRGNTATSGSRAGLGTTAG